MESGDLQAPGIPPHASGELELDLPPLQGVDAVYLAAKNPAGQTLWTWSWPVTEADTAVPAAPTGKVTATEAAGQLVVNAGEVELRFGKSTGYLLQVNVGGRIVPLSSGPRFIAYSRDHLGHRPVTYADVAGTGTLTGLAARADGGDLVVEADYAGAFKQAIWRISPGGRVKLDYSYVHDGPVDLLGIGFDFPESEMKAITWMGYGPYRVWQNRLQRTRLDVWHSTYNNTVPSVVYSFDPEFKGYFRGWRWATFATAACIHGEHCIGKSYLGVYTPNDGTDGPLLALPQTGLAFLDVIPAMRDKFLSQDRMGPQSAQRQVSGEHKGEVNFDFGGG